MEDFLKNRPVLDPKSALVLAADPKPPSSAVRPPVAAESGPSSAAGSSPFGELRGVTAASAPRPAAKAGLPPPSADAAAPAVAAQSLKGEHGTKVQTVVERGRVVKIVVTCTCGTVTEIACQY